MRNSDNLTPLGKAVYWAKKAEHAKTEYFFSEEVRDRVLRQNIELSRMWLRIADNRGIITGWSVAKTITEETTIEDDGDTEIEDATPDA
jgi:hypothetical protein